MWSPKLGPPHWTRETDLGGLPMSATPASFKDGVWWERRSSSLSRPPSLLLVQVLSLAPMSLSLRHLPGPLAKPETFFSYAVYSFPDSQDKLGKSHAPSAGARVQPGWVTEAIPGPGITSQVLGPLSWGCPPGVNLRSPSKNWRGLGWGVGEC